MTIASERASLLLVNFSVVALIRYYATLLVRIMSILTLRVISSIMSGRWASHSIEKSEQAELEYNEDTKCAVVVVVATPLCVLIVESKSFFSHNEHQSA